MDHRVAKDMISSGMIPSGEKKKEDLGRTQYGSAPSPSSLADAYKSMYDKKEETLNEHHKKDADGNTIPHEGEELNELSKETLDSYITKAHKDINKPGKKSYGKGNKIDRYTRVLKAVQKRDRKELRMGLQDEYHKKDADGNTIPHEDEEINEILGIGAIATAGKALLTKIGKTAIGSQVKNIGKKVVKDFKKNPLDTAVKASVVANSLPKPGMPNVPAVEKQKSQGGMRSTQYASADLFDIVKGQLLDEGLSEEEIRDIMLTLTPDEIMSEMAVNPNIAAMDAKNKADMIARAQANKVPDKVKEASKRQMKAGTPREDKNNPYTTQDKKTIIDYNKNK